VHGAPGSGKSTYCNNLNGTDDHRNVFDWSTMSINEALLEKEIKRSGNNSVLALDNYPMYPGPLLILKEKLQEAFGEGLFYGVHLLYTTLQELQQNRPKFVIEPFQRISFYKKKISDAKNLLGENLVSKIDYVFRVGEIYSEGSEEDLFKAMQ